MLPARHGRSTLTPVAWTGRKCRPLGNPLKSARSIAWSSPIFPSNLPAITRVNGPDDRLTAVPEFPNNGLPARCRTQQPSVSTHSSGNRDLVDLTKASPIPMSAIPPHAPQCTEFTTRLIRGVPPMNRPYPLVTQMTAGARGSTDDKGRSLPWDSSDTESPIGFAYRTSSAHQQQRITDLRLIGNHAGNDCPPQEP